MNRFFAISASVALHVATFATPAFAARPLVSVEYRCPVTIQLTIKKELPPVTTSKGTSNAVAEIRMGNRDFLRPLVAQYGGKLADWSIVAYGSSDTFDEESGLTVFAKRKSGEVYSLVPDLSSIEQLSVRSNVHSLKRSPEGELLSATYNQLYLVTWDDQIGGGTFLGTGTALQALSYGLVKIGKRSVRAHKPLSTNFQLKGRFVDEAGDASVAELSVKFGSPRLVPVYGEETQTGGTPPLIVIGTDEHVQAAE